MDTDPPIFRDLIRFRPEGLSLNAWAVKAGVSRTVWADMRRHGNPSRRTLEKLLGAANSSLAEFEALRIHDGAAAPFAGDRSSLSDSAGRQWAPAPLPPLPLYDASLVPGLPSWGAGVEVLQLRETEFERVPRPPSMAGDRDAYALPVVGGAMEPRFRQSRRIAVSPRQPCAEGDDVLVILSERGPAGAKLALLKQLASRSDAAIELRQYNPDLTFEVEARAIEAMHRIMGELF